MKLKLTALFLSSSLLFGQEEGQPNEVPQLDPLVIESSPLSPPVSEATQAWSVLSGEELEKAKGATIAETLSGTPGVSQTGFGPAANRPIIRGMDKFRVRMLQNGTDTFDVSAQSEDHAVPIDPLLVDRIEVLRGASALLYGGSAIGGAVNVIDRSIPTTPYGEPGASLLSSYNSANEGWNYGATAFGSSGKLNFQINGSKRDFEDYDAPSFYTEDHHSGTISGPFNKVENSYGDSSTIGFGGSYMLDSGYAGLSFSRYESTYGVPGEHADNLTYIEMESDRFEFRSEIEVAGSDWLNGIELNFGYGDYKHSEIGYENGAPPFEIHSTFLRKGYEGRIAFDHDIGELSGVFGVHGLFDELKIDGHESILGGLTQAPDTANPKITSEDSSKIALFLIEEYDLDAETTLNAGIRGENQDRDYQATGPLDPDRDDSTFSATGGISRDINEMWNISGNLSYSERAPDTAELYSDGPHHATEAYEFGSPNLDIESARGVEIVVRKTVGKVTGQFSAFHTRFNNYVFLEDAEKVRDGEGNLADDPGPDTILGNGDDEFVDPNTEGLPVKGYEAAKAEFQGIEIEIDWLAMENPGWNLLLSAYGDMLRGKNKTEGVNLARIPATRVGLGFEVQQEKFDFGAKFIRSFKQDKVAVHDDHSEDPTAAHSLLSAYASYDFSAGDSVGEVFLRGYNLTDELAYNHSSLLKQFAPLPGRSVEIGLKFDF